MTRQAADLKKGCPSSPNSGHTATVLRTSAQIRQSRTSHVRRMLSEIGRWLRERKYLKIEGDIL